MPAAANSLYPNGPDQSLGNENPDKVLSTFPGNHEGALLWGEDKHREAYVKKYGYEKTLSIIDSALKSSDAKGTKTPEGAWYDDMEQYKNELLARQQM